VVGVLAFHICPSRLRSGMASSAGSSALGDAPSARMWNNLRAFLLILGDDNEGNVQTHVVAEIADVLGACSC
jgi:hypothetical protein